MKEWHPTLNEKSIEDYVLGSNESVHQLCKQCGHAWEAQIVTRTIGGHGCRKRVHEEAAQEEFAQPPRLK
ncbi:MAG: hypothetical protein FI710_07885 [SAR202 cluster bacterium]|nr:hypothetical protein [SAR202 cluster bacterium]